MFDVVVLFFLNLLEVDQVFLVGLFDLVDFSGVDGVCDCDSTVFATISFISSL